MARCDGCPFFGPQTCLSKYVQRRFCLLWTSALPLFLNFSSESDQRHHAQRHPWELSVRVSVLSQLLLISIVSYRTGPSPKAPPYSYTHPIQIPHNPHGEISLRTYVSPTHAHSQAHTRTHTHTFLPLRRYVTISLASRFFCLPFPPCTLLPRLSAPAPHPLLVPFPPSFCFSTPAPVTSESFPPAPGYRSHITADVR